MAQYVISCALPMERVAHLRSTVYAPRQRAVWSQLLRTEELIRKPHDATLGITQQALISGLRHLAGTAVHDPNGNPWVDGGNGGRELPSVGRPRRRVPAHVHVRQPHGWLAPARYRLLLISTSTRRSRLLF